MMIMMRTALQVVSTTMTIEIPQTCSWCLVLQEGIGGFKIFDVGIPGTVYTFEPYYIHL
jgi:hypothetical protein